MAAMSRICYGGEPWPYQVVRRGGSAGNCALVALNSLPTECLEQVKGNPGGKQALCWIYETTAAEWGCSGFLVGLLILPVEQQTNLEICSE